ncbi:hypothetical protein AB1N83_010783, partial [Pleurotus pulmonarius]
PGFTSSISLLLISLYTSLNFTLCRLVMGVNRRNGFMCALDL